MEDRAFQLKFRAQFKRIDQVAVVGKGHSAFYVIDHYGLGVVPVCRACGAVADVAYSHVAGAELLEYFRGKDVVHQAEILVGIEQSVVVDNYAA